MAKRLFRFCGLLAFVQVLLIAHLAIAADAVVDFDKQARTWDRAVEKIEKRVGSGRTGSLEERDLRAELKTIADAAVAAREAALKQAKQSKGLLDALGPPPAEDANTESEVIQKRRKELGKDLSTFEGNAKQAGLIIAKVDQALAKITSRSRSRLKDVLFDRSVSPLNHKAWVIAAPEAAQLFKASFVEAPEKWWMELQTNPSELVSLWRNLTIALMAAVAGWVVGLWLRRRFGRVQGGEQPSYSRRLLAGLAEGGGRSLAPIIFVVLVGGLLFDRELIQDPLKTVVEGVVRDLVLFFFGYALINAGLTPLRQEWHLLDFGQTASRILSFRLKLALGVFLTFDGLYQATSWATPSEELGSVAAFLFTLSLVPLLISMMSSRIWGALAAFEEPNAKTPESQFPRLRAFMTMGLVALPIAAVIGYPGLAAYLMRAIVMSVLVLAGFGLLRSVGRESLAMSLDSGGLVGRGIRNIFALDSEAGERTLFWLRTVLDLILLTVAAFVLLPIWGLGAEESAMSLAKLMRGIQIGSYTLSLVDILIGLSIFLAIIFVTRLIQKGLERHILPNLTKDKGVRDALKTGVGYIGVVVAFLAAVAVLGLDLTNLALIAGALSVGLGFGLQNVVNNFVSGLILLAERPIKPGDWVVIGGHEGKVKKVNVRSTEVETFQRASVIIPNADLIATPVVNWTHKNILGRVEVMVGVAYGTDPRLVKSVLLDCAKSHPNVMGYPEPSVLFTDFADSSLNFELRAFLSDVEQRLQTGSDIRFAIHDAFKEKGIEIPFPQRVLHMAPATPAPSVEPGTDV
ncbi:mechanosensitive ion channel domain-containing protein [Magnetovibrio sp.]|uniref:mechanosensitive ion channel domain-containing protein n=1 Tax=Magnetovibrio sp. TaxID=2024836 RepID=UPI002F91E833